MPFISFLYTHTWSLIVYSLYLLFLLLLFFLAFFSKVAFLWWCLHWYKWTSRELLLLYCIPPHWLWCHDLKVKDLSIYPVFFRNRMMIDAIGYLEVQVFLSCVEVAKSTTLTITCMQSSAFWNGIPVTSSIYNNCIYCPRRFVCFLFSELLSLTSFSFLVFIFCWNQILTFNIKYLWF